MTINLQNKTTEQRIQIPYRMALAGGWIDQPLISKYNPEPPGSMVVVSLKPNIQFMDRCGMGTSTRNVAAKIWGNAIPDEDPVKLMHELYVSENRSKPDPSGSQDMAGIIYPGISRLDYDVNFEGGIFPVRIESNNDTHIAKWLENIIHIVPVNQRPIGYDPLGEKNLDPAWIRRLGQTGKDCFDAIISQSATKLGASMNECMNCWQAILPNTVTHSTIKVDLLEILASYQKQYFGAMFSGCGGGYLYVVSDKPVHNSLKVNIRIEK
ncbi:MAG: hypothetical protein AB9891_12325 [Anaerolineaceae bacterium]